VFLRRKTVANYKVGIDVGGTFTDFVLAFEDGSSRVYKVLSTPEDPSIATIRGLEEMASDLKLGLKGFLREVSAIIHGTTVTTNAVLTRTGAKTALLTTRGVRDALEMRRGIREEQYNNRYKNVVPLVERYLRIPIDERMDYKGEPIVPIDLEQVKKATNFLRQEGVEAVAVCFMNSFASDVHEREAAKVVDKDLGDAYLTVSSKLLPSIRFFDRISTTVLNSYVGPILRRYLNSLMSKLQKLEYAGILLIMQSNGGVISPDLAMEQAAVTLLSGPAGGPAAGIAYTTVSRYDSCITVDMGGTSFDASLVENKSPIVTTTGEIDRLRLALPMLYVRTIGAGGGSIAWIDEGGLLRMGPQSAGANPGPACYGLGGQVPTCTDADLVLGYLDEAYFAGGRMPLSMENARTAIEEHIAKPLKYDLYEAAVGMYNVINVNMAAAVREVSVKQGYDPRDFPLVVAGGAGPNHACMIALELEIPVMIIPKESSIFCAAGMLMSDLKHDFVRTYATLLNDANPEKFKGLFEQMKRRGMDVLNSEGIRKERIEYLYSLDLRYVKQYHEVNVVISEEEVANADFDSMAARFHPQHNKLFGYSLEDEGTAIELINMRFGCVGKTEKPVFREEVYGGEDPSKAYKRRRRAFLPIEKKFIEIDVFDGAKLQFGNKVVGPAIIEQIHTTTFVSPEYSVLVDRYGSYTVYLKAKEEEIRKRVMK
jgi:N-methylhydantoinase A